MRDPPATPKEMLREVIDILSRWGYANAAELARELWKTQSFMSGFLWALEALGVLEGRRWGGGRLYRLRYENFKKLEEVIKT